MSISHAFKKTSAGNYFGYYKGYYVFTYRRPHGKWCCCIGKRGEWLCREGYFGTSLFNLNIAKRWAENAIWVEINKLKA